MVSQVDEDGEPVDTDLTGCTGRIQFRHHSKSGELGLEISGDDIEFDGDTITIAKRAPGEFLTQVGDWYGTLLMTWPSEDVDPVLDVIVTVTDGATK